MAVTVAVEVAVVAGEAAAASVKRCTNLSYVKDWRVDDIKQQLQMEDCGVCYTNQPRCRLVCGHSFCYDCVKTWYQKSDEPSCPMCRGSLYFKHMRHHLDKWEDERIDKHNEECFNEVFESLFDEEEMEFYGSEDIMWEIEELQKRYHQFVDTGYDMEEILNEYDEDIFVEYLKHFWPVDIAKLYLFISKHKFKKSSRRTGKRITGNTSNKAVACSVCK